MFVHEILMFTNIEQVEIMNIKDC